MLYSQKMGRADTAAWEHQQLLQADGGKNAAVLYPDMLFQKILVGKFVATGKTHRFLILKLNYLRLIFKWIQMTYGQNVSIYRPIQRLLKFAEMWVAEPR